MNKTRTLWVFVAITAIVTTSLAMALGKGDKHQPKPLTMDQKMMMKNGAMKNMDKYMSSKKAMMQLPMRMKSSQEGTIKWGEELFNDSKALSTNGQACASCHPGGGTTGGEAETPMKSEVTGETYKLPIPTLVGAAATFPKYKVPNDKVIDVTDMANNCIMMFMMAQPLEKNSKEARALTAYIATLSNDDKVSVGKMPEMMQKMMSGKMK